MFAGRLRSALLPTPRPGMQPQTLRDKAGPRFSYVRRLWAPTVSVGLKTTLHASISDKLPVSMLPNRFVLSRAWKWPQSGRLITVV